MFKKIFYSLTILAMLVGMFGVMGKGGVTPARAADSGFWNDDLVGILNAPVPYFNAAVDMTTANGSLLNNRGGCAVAPSFGNYQLFLWESDHADPLTYSYVRVRVVSNDFLAASWAVLVSEDVTSAELGCATNPASGIVDFTVAVPAGFGFVVTLASNGAFIPLDATYETWVYTTSNAGGGLIVDMRADAGTQAARLVEASPAAGGVATFNDPAIGADMQAYLDVPAGAYNLGVQDQSANAELAVYVPGVTAPGFLTLNPTLLASIPVTVRIENELGVPTNLNIKVNTNASLVVDLELGFTNLGAEGIGWKTFSLNPGAWGWDVAAYADNAANQYYLVERNVNTLLGDVDFRLDTVAHQVVLLCYQDNGGGAFAYDDVDVLGVDPIGNLTPLDFDINNDGDPLCAGITDGGKLFLSAGVSYSGMRVRIIGDDDWVYFFDPTINVWNSPGAVGEHDPCYSFIFGGTPFVSTAA